jgi:hypothetical protein
MKVPVGDAIHSEGQLMTAFLGLTPKLLSYQSYYKNFALGISYVHPGKQKLFNEKVTPNDRVSVHLPLCSKGFAGVPATEEGNSDVACRIDRKTY